MSVNFWPYLYVQSITNSGPPTPEGGPADSKGSHRRTQSRTARRSRQPLHGRPSDRPRRRPRHWPGRTAFWRGQSRSWEQGPARWEHRGDQGRGRGGEPIKFAYSPVARRRSYDGSPSPGWAAQHPRREPSSRSAGRRKDGEGGEEDLHDRHTQNARAPDSHLASIQAA